MAGNLTRWALIDDIDPSITYTGDWYETEEQFGRYNRFGPPHYGSQHATNTSGSASFAFRGSRVAVFGTSRQLNTTSADNSTSVSIDPRWECIVDGRSHPAIPGSNESFATNQWTLCDVQFESSGQHVLTVAANTTSRTFYLDLIQYKPDHNLQETLHPTILLVSTDPAVKYMEGNWASFLNQAMVSTEPGSKVRIEFNGTKAIWVGAFSPQYPRGSSTATYSIDSEQPIEFTIPAFPGESNRVLWYQPFFETPTLSRGAHTLEVVHQGSSAPLILHYLMIDNGDILPSASRSTTNDVSPDKPGDAEPAHQDTPVGIVIGSAVGAIAFIAIFVSLLYFCFKHQKRRRRARNTLTAPNFASPSSTGNVQSINSTTPLTAGTHQIPSPLVSSMYPPTASFPNSQYAGAPPGLVPMRGAHPAVPELG
ncbi:hypothetical protein FA15DRAFT_727512 [Coprinopsis marcescibilis]|uniref:Transmembrane protein n=1 Tax=Coprinopsis marcescibilis TaxID=230819 RepID=A0A5C3KFY6_COPMA|nr:hypothetical protein FA15DRAFT_727512 [Coprinopsis marcescibilis]